MAATAVDDDDTMLKVKYLKGKLTAESPPDDHMVSIQCTSFRVVTFCKNQNRYLHFACGWHDIVPNANFYILLNMVTSCISIPIIKLRGCKCHLIARV